MSGIIQFLTIGGKVVQGLATTAQVGVAAYDIYDATRKRDPHEEIPTWQKVLRVSTGTLSIVANTAHCGTAIAGENLSAEFRIAIAASAAGANVAHRGSSLVINREITADLWIDLSGLIVFEIAGVLNHTCYVRPQTFGKHTDVVREVTHAFQSASVLVMGRKQIMKWGSQIWRTLELFMPSPDDINTSDILIQLDNEQADPLLHVGEEYYQEISDLQQIVSVEHLTAIPKIFRFDQELKKHKCSITKQPMREVVYVRSSPLASPVSYDKSALENWFSEHPDQLPPKWPESVPSHLSQAQPDSTIQNQINTRLEYLLNNIKELSVEAMRPIIPDRLTSILDGSSVIQLGTKICKDILQKEWMKPFIASIKNRMEDYTFTHQPEPQISHCIEVGFHLRRSSSCPIEPSQLPTAVQAERLIKIILGCEDDEKTKVVRTATNLIKGLRIYIAHTNLKLYDVMLIA